MYICICNAIPERDLRSQARTAPGTAEQLYAELGHAPRCRQCLEQAERIVFEERGLLHAA